MFRKFILPVVAVVLLGVAIYHVVVSGKESPKTPPPVEPARTPFKATVAGAGIVEAEAENIAMGSPLPGVVVEVAVKVGKKVKPGDPLFRLDDRALKADLEVRRASLAAAQAQLAKWDSMPRPEEVPVTEARVREAQANLTDQQDQLNRAREVFPRRAISEEEMIRREQAFRMAKEQLTRSEAELRLLKAGAWEADKAVARANIALAKAQLEQVQTDLDRLTVRAQADGEVLQVNVRPGEFAGAPPDRTLILLGNVRRLHVRVDIDEHDIPRFKPDASAKANRRGHPDPQFPLKFVRVEPYVIPKRSLTGDNTERVDTRVLQVIYALDPKDAAVYVGQQLEVFLDVGSQ